MIDLGEDGEMELKAEYRGRVQYMDGDYGGHPEDEELWIEIFMTEERKGPSH
jgi:hypothetical protein